MNSPDNAVVFKRDGKVVHMDDARSEVYGKAYRLGMFYEDDFLHYLASLQLSGTYVDIGANIGNHSVYFGLFTTATRVIGFEPIVHYHRIAAANVERNRLTDRVHVENLGLSDSSGRVRIEFDRVEQEADVITLDEYGLPAGVAVMKIDVEGMEPSVLRGATHTLEQERPLLYIEAIQPTDSPSVDSTRIDDVLEPLGYRPTGRVFNYQPTIEYVHPESPYLSALPTGRQEIVLDRLVTNNPRVRLSSDSRTCGATFQLNSRAWLATSMSDFALPDWGGDFDLRGATKLYLEVENSVQREPVLSYSFNQYSDKALVQQDKFYVNRRTVRPIIPHHEATSARIMIALSGSGQVSISKIALSSF